MRLGDTTWPVAGPDLPEGASVRVVGVEDGRLVVEPAEDGGRTGLSRSSRAAARSPLRLDLDPLQPEPAGHQPQLPGQGRRHFAP